VFSDPPINAAEIIKTGPQARLKTGVTWDMKGDAAHLPDGVYTAAIRPHHVTPFATNPEDVALKGTVQVTELSGSESSAHFQIGGDGWVSLAHGVHPYEIGQDHAFYMNASHFFYFAPDGRLVA
jgi:glycerol transport system ATP-binding protein